MRSNPTLYGALALTAAFLTAVPATASSEGLVSGRVSGASVPLPASQVYAYQLADLTLRKVTTDEGGFFSFQSLPTGLYKIIAFKPGFVPGVALLTRASTSAAQFLEVELQSQEDAAASSDADFWSVRQQIPTDVLRDIDLMAAGGEMHPGVLPLDRVRAEMRAVTGVDNLIAAQTAQLSGGEVDVTSEIDNVNVDVSGRYMALETGVGELAPATAGHSQALSVDVTGVGTNRIRVTSADNSLRRGSDREHIGLQSHRLTWSRDIGETGRSEIAAQYTEEDNFYARGGTHRVALPPGSRTWRVEGTYSTALGEHSSFEAGFRYRERDFDELVTRHLNTGDLLEERVEVFGRAGTAITPAVVMEYGVYSTMRDGTLSFMPQGGVILQLGDHWRATTSASLKMHEDPIEARRLDDFHTTYFQDYASCERAAAECYQVVLARFDEDQEKLSIGAIHRRFDETLRLQFDQNFFNFHENLQLVHGDAVPELQFALTQRLTPNILTRLQSNFGAGGGGRMIIPGRYRNRHYENEVRYVVTSVDTLFEQTATGVFVAFHHLEQRLNSERFAMEQLLELERLQLKLTQELALLGSVAADWAVQLNMELSRGSLPSSEQLESMDEIRSRVTGGFAVRF